jgi:hypothetical protein
MGTIGLESRHTPRRGGSIPLRSSLRTIWRAAASFGAVSFSVRRPVVASQAEDRSSPGLGNQLIRQSPVRFRSTDFSSSSAR